MSLVFALRLHVTSAFLLLLLVALSLAGILPGVQVQALAFLFCYFLSLVAVVLCVIRFKKRASQVLALAPALAFPAPAPFREPLLVIGLVLFLEAFCRESRSVGRVWGYRLAQFVLLGMSTSGFFAPQEQWKWLFFLTMAAGVAFTLGCASWQRGIKLSLGQMDID